MLRAFAMSQSLMQPYLTHREVTILRPMAYPDFVASYLLEGKRKIRRRERRK
jgi:hypothetical protein